MKLCKAPVRPVVVYGSECWVLTENIKQKLLVFERKILRRIFGPTQKPNGEWRLKINEELEEAINNENIVRYIKYKRLGWLGACRKNDQIKSGQDQIQMGSVCNKTEGKAKSRMGRRCEE